MVYSLNGEETYLEGKQKDISDETILLDLKKGLPDEVSEAVLEVILSMEEEQAHFYTRITRPEDLFSDTAKSSHQKYPSVCLPDRFPLHSANTLYIQRL